MEHRAKSNWINFYQALIDRNKRGSLPMRIWRHLYLRSSQECSMHFGGYALKPIELNVEISNQCNLRCRMCPSRIFEQRTQCQPDPGVLCNLIPQLGVKVVRFSGLGEPMVAPLFWDLAEAVHRSGCRIAMVTNGTMLDKHAIEKLCGISSMLTISLDSATSETYRYIRGVDAFESIYTAIGALHRQKSFNRSSLPIIAVNWVLMKSNYGELPLLVRRLREDGIKIDLIHCDPLVSYSSEIDNEVLPAHFQGLREYLEEVRNEALSAGIYFEYPYYTIIRTAANQSGNNTRRASCNVIWESLFLSLQKEFLPCCEYYLDPVGSMFNTDPRDAWNSTIMREARMRSLLNLPPFSYCKNCHKYTGTGDADRMLRRAQR